MDFNQIVATGTTKFGTLNELNSDMETIAKYLDLVLLYFEANEVANDKRVPILLSSIGPTTYSLICDLAAPANPKRLTLPAIPQLLKDNFEPKRLIIAERFTFHRRNQRPGETMAEYDAALRKLAVTCEFETYLEEALRDRFVCDFVAKPFNGGCYPRLNLPWRRPWNSPKGWKLLTTVLED